MFRSKWRQRPVLRLRRYLLKNHSPRHVMGGVLLSTGLVGFLTSVWLLGQGLSSMSLRYPAAAAIAYVYFLVMVVLTVVYYRWRVRKAHSDIKELVPHPPKLRDRKSSFGMLDGSDLLVDEGCLIISVLILFGGLPWVAVHVTRTAPTLLAELLLDSLLISGLHRQIRTAEPNRLAVTTFRRTLGLALFVFVLLGIFGWGFEAYAPGAVTLGDVFAKLVDRE